MTLIFKNMSYRFQHSILLEDICFMAKPGQITALLGPNGAGKSTFLELAGGLKTATSGEIIFNGNDIKTFSPKELAKNRALLAQNSFVAAPFTVLEMVKIAFHSCDIFHSEQKKNMLVKQALESVRLEQKADQTIQTLSGGERQRAHLARIFLQLELNRQSDCQVLLLDEPFSAQDPAQHLLIVSLVKKHVQKGGIVLMILHDLNWASAVADHIILLQKGRIYAQGPPQTVLKDMNIGPVFGLPTSVIKQHKQTNRPYLIAHDMLLAGHEFQP